MKNNGLEKQFLFVYVINFLKVCYQSEMTFNPTKFSMQVYFFKVYLVF